jgi:hypothetical protein
VPPQRPHRRTELGPRQRRTLEINPGKAVDL